jgi:hypothetical protein
MLGNALAGTLESPGSPVFVNYESRLSIFIGRQNCGQEREDV